MLCQLTLPLMTYVKLLGSRLWCGFYARIPEPMMFF